MTLIDLNGELGRIDGGIGLAIEEPSIQIKAAKADKTSIDGPFRERAFKVIEKLRKNLKLSEEIKININKSYEPHQGLGSGTQIDLAIGTAYTLLCGERIRPTELARNLNRGGTSGIGIAAFEKGGFIMDGGHSRKEKKEFLPSSASKAAPPPILLRRPFPDWDIALITPRGRSIEGQGEVDIFSRYCPIPRKEVERLSHIILMKLLPALVEKDLSVFGDALNDIQNTGFKRIELSLQPPSIKDVLKRCQKNSYGAGLSSFGPTIYCLTDNVEDLRAKLPEEPNIKVTKANNKGALIKEFTR